MKTKSYLSDVSDDDWAFVAPYLASVIEDAPRHEHSLREVFNGLRFLVRTGASWQMMPNDLPPWHIVYLQTQRWLDAKVFEDIVRDLRLLMSEIEGRPPESQVVIQDNRTCHSISENGARIEYVRHKRPEGRKVPKMVDTLGQLIAALIVSPNALNQAQVAELVERLRVVTGDPVAITFEGQGYIADLAASGVEESGIRLEVIKLSSAKRGFVLLPPRWLDERGSSWMTRIRRSARDYERLVETMAVLQI